MEDSKQSLTGGELMKALRYRIRDAVVRQGIPQHVIEKDYAISYILTGISGHRALQNALVFKGGTALKKLFFGDYRFSEDLDFSASESLKGNHLESALAEAVEAAGKLFSEQGPFDTQFERYLEREPHPRGQDAFTIRVKFPWHPSALCRIKAEITHDEIILMKPEKRRLIHGYEENLSCEILCYRLEEIFAEKLRALLQTHQKLAARGWNPPRVRDYYDLWRILAEFRPAMDLARIEPLLERKCEHSGVSVRSANDFFSDELVSEAVRHWDSSLGPFVAELPECPTVLDSLKAHLRELLPSYA